MKYVTTIGERQYAIEINRDYLEGSAVRFENLQFELTNRSSRKKTA